MLVDADVTTLPKASTIPTLTTGLKFWNFSMFPGCWVKLRPAIGPGLRVKESEVAPVRPLEVAESVLPAPATPENVTELKVATPEEAVTGLVPLTVTPLPPRVIEADDPVTVFALASTTRTETGVPKLLPALTDAAGCCTKARAAAGPTFRVKEFEVAEVSPLDVAESVLPAPAVPLKVTELNVATPAVAVTVAVPLTVTPVPPLPPSFDD